MKFEKPFLLRALTLACVMITAYVLRFTGLGDIPTGPYWDEAAIGYNAYSILETGRDEYGIPYPISFRSFNDYKPPLYIYLTVPAVALFGLNIWSVRLISVLSWLMRTLMCST